MNIATNIAKTGEFKDAYFFHSICECTSNDHSQQLVLEIDEDGYYVSCTIFQDLFWMERNYSDKWYARVWFRLKNATKYLFTGHARISGEHLFTKDQHIKDYAGALLGSVDELNKRKEAYLSSMQSRTGNDKR